MKFQENPCIWNAFLHILHQFTLFLLEYSLENFIVNFCCWAKYSLWSTGNWTGLWLSAPRTSKSHATLHLQVKLLHRAPVNIPLQWNATYSVACAEVRWGQEEGKWRAAKDSVVHTDACGADASHCGLVSWWCGMDPPSVPIRFQVLRCG
jgi:hypothetical protein